jgi:universal stress protein A
MHLPTRILVPVNFDAASRAALLVATQVAGLTGAQLRLVHVWIVPYAVQPIDEVNMPGPEGNLFDGLRHECAARLQEFIGSCGLDSNASNVCWSIHSGDPATEILAEVKNQDCDWVVMGTHQRHGLNHWLNGSVADSVLRHATCPVLIVPNAMEVVASSVDHQAGDKK